MAEKALHIELKRLRVNERLSDETLCYSADLYVDGRKLGTVGNRGCGGCDEQDIPRDRLAYLNVYCAAHYPPVVADVPQDLESVCHGLVARLRTLAVLRRRCRTAVCFVRPSDPSGVYHMLSVRGVRALTPDHLERARTFLATRYGADVRILNALSDAEVLATLST